MSKTKALLAILLAGSASVHADCVAQSAATRPPLVELYTSEGCSSCPPAEAWLRGLRNGAAVVALEFHVDYWDTLGWRDRFDDARYTARQNAIAARDGGTTVYTPQVVLDGRNWQGWYRGASVPAAVAATASMQLAVRAGDMLQVRIDTQGAGDLAGYRTYVALLEDGLVSHVGAGENNGASLRHDHLVRAFTGPLPIAAAQTELALPRDLLRDHASIVAWAQNPNDGRVAQVVTLPLAQCR